MGQEKDQLASKPVGGVGELALFLAWAVGRRLKKVMEDAVWLWLEEWMVGMVENWCSFLQLKSLVAIYSRAR